MITGSKTDSIASTHLGKRADGSLLYDPSLLVAVPREENREQYGIKADKLPFAGYDVWHCYEFSALTESGLPVTRVLKLKYSCESPNIVESKSLKLYLNSFNMTRLGKNTEDCLKKSAEFIEKDLENILSTDVEINFLSDGTEKVEVFSDYIDLSELVGDGVEVSDYVENPDLLKFEQINETKNSYYLKFGSLRSNCRVTHQPDFGDLFIYYKSAKVINYDSLVKYLVSFRSEYHFHEECCEMIFKRLYDLLDDGDVLMVAALYTRRGGIDISPVRYTNGLKNEDVEKLLDLSAFARCGIKQ